MEFAPRFSLDSGLVHLFGLLGSVQVNQLVTTFLQPQFMVFKEPFILFFEVDLPWSFFVKCYVCLFALCLFVITQLYLGRGYRRSHISCRHMYDEIDYPALIVVVLLSLEV